TATAAGASDSVVVARVVVGALMVVLPARGGSRDGDGVCRVVVVIVVVIRSGITLARSSWQKLAERLMYKGDKSLTSSKFSRDLGFG
ncbi:hypothetical protein ACFP2T_43760, partial [Plantactinospora solaniradicis]